MLMGWLVEDLLEEEWEREEEQEEEEDLHKGRWGSILQGIGLRAKGSDRRCGEVGMGGAEALPT